MLDLIWLSSKGSSDGEFWWVEGMPFHIPFLPLLTGAYISPIPGSMCGEQAEEWNTHMYTFRKILKKSHVIQFSAVYLKFSI